MSIEQNALSKYWDLRDQGKSPDEAAEHVRLTFGIVIDTDMLHAADEVAFEEVSDERIRAVLDKAAEYCKSKDDSINLGFGSEFTRTIYGCYDSGRRS
jgi:flagellar biosynthesis/type III secretory pathway M-ring protein FliF/YscJ